jgi:hypothetical protein
MMSVFERRCYRYKEGFRGFCCENGCESNDKSHLRRRFVNLRFLKNQTAIVFVLTQHEQQKHFKWNQRTYTNITTQTWYSIRSTKKESLDFILLFYWERKIENENRSLEISIQFNCCCHLTNPSPSFTFLGNPKKQKSTSPIDIIVCRLSVSWWWCCPSFSLIL